MFLEIEQLVQDLANSSPGDDLQSYVCRARELLAEADGNPVHNQKGARVMVLSPGMIRGVLRKESALLPGMFEFVLPRWMQFARALESAVIRRLEKLGKLDISTIKKL